MSATDEQLVTRLRQGDNTATGELYQRYYMVVFAKCLAFSKNNEDASDFTQEVMLKVMEKINTFKGTSRFSTWLFSVTCNYCTDQVRKSKGKHIESLEHCFELTDESEMDKKNGIEEDKKIEKIYKTLDEISPEDRQLLLMKYQFNKSIVELQHLYQLSSSAVKMRLMRARNKAIKKFRFRQQRSVEQ